MNPYETHPVAGKWQCRETGNVYRPEEVLEKLLQSEQGVMLLEGGSGCGKTRMLHRFREQRGKPVCVCSYEELTMELINQYKKVGGQTAAERIHTLLEAYDTVAVEDLDYLRGRTYTQRDLGSIFLKASQNMLVILTGIDLGNQIPDLLEQLENPVWFTVVGEEREENHGQ